MDLDNYLNFSKYFRNIKYYDLECPTHTYKLKGYYVSKIVLKTILGYL